MWFQCWLADRNFSAGIRLDVTVTLCFYLVPLHISIKGGKGGHVIKWKCFVFQPCKRSSNACTLAPVDDVCDSPVSTKV